MKKVFAGIATLLIIAVFIFIPWGIGMATLKETYDDNIFVWVMGLGWVIVTLYPFALIALAVVIILAIYHAILGE